MKARDYRGPVMLFDALPSDAAKAKAMETVLSYTLMVARSLLHQAKGRDIHAVINLGLVRRVWRTYDQHARMSRDKELLVRIIKGNLCQFTPDGEYVYFYSPEEILL